MNWQEKNHAKILEVAGGPEEASQVRVFGMFQGTLRDRRVGGRKTAPPSKKQSPGEGGGVPDGKKGVLICMDLAERKKKSASVLPKKKG